MIHLKHLIAGTAAIAFLGLTSPASAEDDVRLRLNWMYYGSHAGFALGKEAGSPGGYSSAPGESTCRFCHSSYQLNSGSASFSKRRSCTA